MRRKSSIFSCLSRRKGSLSILCVCVLPAVVLVFLLLSDICILAVAKSKLETAVCAGCRTAVSQYRATGMISRATVKKICTENYPGIEDVEVKLQKPAGYDGTDGYAEVTACAYIRTNILRDYKQETMPVRAGCMKRLN